MEWGWGVWEEGVGAGSAQGQTSAAVARLPTATPSRCCSSTMLVVSFQAPTIWTPTKTPRQAKHSPEPRLRVHGVVQLLLGPLGAQRQQVVAQHALRRLKHLLHGRQIGRLLWRGAEGCGVAGWEGCCSRVMGVGHWQGCHAQAAGARGPAGRRMGTGQSRGKGCQRPHSGCKRPTLSMPTAWEPWPGNRKATGPEGAALGLAGAAAASACAGNGSISRRQSYHLRTCRSRAADAPLHA